MIPELSQKLAQPVTDIYLRVEDQILINIAKKLKRDRSLLTEEGFSSWQLIKLNDINGLTQENIALIAHYSGMASNEVTSLLSEQGYKSISDTDKLLELPSRRGIIALPPESVGTNIQQVMEMYDTQLKTSLNGIGSTMMAQGSLAYSTIINETVGLVAAGVYTPDQALRESVSRLAANGIPALIDRAGKRWSPEAYVNMVTRTTINTMTNEVQLERANDYGVDLVEVSSHSGARPKCFPYQGRVFSRTGSHPYYPPLSSTSYGELDGLMGINCRHIFYPFVEGVSIRRPSRIEDTENDRIYRESQKQRYLERRIRHAKREKNLMEVIGDEEGAEAAKKTITLRQEAMRDFIGESGRTRRRNREQIA